MATGRSRPAAATGRPPADSEEEVGSSDTREIDQALDRARGQLHGRLGDSCQGDHEAGRVVLPCPSYDVRHSERPGAGISENLRFTVGPRVPPNSRENPPIPTPTRFQFPLGSQISFDNSRPFRRSAARDQPSLVCACAGSAAKRARLAPSRMQRRGSKSPPDPPRSTYRSYRHGAKRR